METTTSTPAHVSVQELQQSWRTFRNGNPCIRLGDAAEQLGVSEAELLAAGCGDTVTRLSTDWSQLVCGLYKLGPVTAQTRNAHAVHEKHGRYRNISIAGNRGWVLGENIDLRLFLSHWHLGFAVEEEFDGKMCRSLQFFDQDGTAVHKVHLNAESRADAFDDLVERYLSPNQSPVQPVQRLSVATDEKSDEAIDRDGLLYAWRRMQHPRTFVDVLKKFGARRIQALRLADRDLAYPVAPAALVQVLNGVTELKTQVKVFVGNKGAVQIHSGLICAIKRIGPWVSVLDGSFNLHLREDHIATAWVVLKPSTDGIVSSLELYDRKGEIVALLFGHRKPGHKEPESWRSILAELPSPTEPVRKMRAGSM